MYKSFLQKNANIQINRKDIAIAFAQILFTIFIQISEHFDLFRALFFSGTDKLVRKSAIFFSLARDIFWHG